jgi:hypothetical protein
VPARDREAEVVRVVVVVVLEEVVRAHFRELVMGLKREIPVIVVPPAGRAAAGVAEHVLVVVVADALAAAVAAHAEEAEAVVVGGADKMKDLHTLGEHSGGI